MKKRTLACLLMLAMLLNVCACAFAEEATKIEIIRCANDPDFSTLTVDEWMNYEFNQDYATVISNVTSYDHDFLRNFLDKHWATYLALAMPPEARGMSDAEQRALLAEHHNMRVSALADEATVESNRIYLWPKGQVPTVTEYIENTGYAYADWPDFEPFMLPMLVEEGVTPKGAVILCAGGSRIFRSNVEETYEVALALNACGYQCFIVNYRLTPYTMAESAIDFARAVRYVRANAEKYGVQENNIACAGFSAGGSVISAAMAEYLGDVNASVIVPDYVPDDLDSVSANVDVYLSVYANYGEDSMRIDNAPPTFFLIGADDGWQSVSKCFDAVRDAGIFTELHTFAGVPHGFGAGTHADGTVYENAATWTILADCFMQNVYAQANVESAAE